MICRVAWRVVSGKGAADERSDDESVFLPYPLRPLLNAFSSDDKKED